MEAFDIENDVVNEPQRFWLGAGITYADDSVEGFLGLWTDEPRPLGVSVNDVRLAHVVDVVLAVSEADVVRFVDGAT